MPRRRILCRNGVSIKIDRERAKKSGREDWPGGAIFVIFRVEPSAGLAAERSRTMNLRRLLLSSLAVGTSLWLRDAVPCAQIARAADKRPPGPKLFIIVAPERFRPALAEYVAYKQKLRPTEVVSLEDVLQSSAGVDAPERLKRYLYEAWHKRRLGYLLLVGDVDVMPVRYMVLDRSSPAAFNYAFYPSDLYYADLAKPDGTFEDWNAMKQGFHARYFGEVRGEKNKRSPINYDQIDYRPEIAFGRWPVSTEKEVAIVAAKTIAYEEAIRDGTHPGLRRADFFNVEKYVDARDRMTGWAAKMPPGWTVGRYFYQDDKKPYQTPPPDEAHVVASLNQGTALAVHVGHGSDHSWFRSFSTGSLKKLRDADRLPVMLSVGCSTGNFAPLPPYTAYVDVEGKEHVGTDHKEVFHSPPPPPSPFQKGKYNPTGLGEQVLKRGPGGAVVYIGCNTGAQPCAVTLAEGFLAAMQRSEQPLVGDCWASAIRYYYSREKLATLVPNNDWYPPSIFFQAMKFMFFGDPTVPFAHSMKKTIGGLPPSSLQGTLQ
jgi:hypothetical protein